MGKITNKRLATQIAKRISELLDITGLTLIGLADFAGIGKSALRSYHSKTIPISVETVSKICDPLSISLFHFFDFNTPLSVDDDHLAVLHQFKKNHLSQGKGYFQEEKKLFVSKPTSTGRKREREYIAYIIYQTDYFKTERTIGQMVIDFAKEHDLRLESGRLYELLKKYVKSKELERKAALRVNNDDSTSKRQIFLYKLR